MTILKRMKNLVSTSLSAVVDDGETRGGRGWRGGMREKRIMASMRKKMAETVTSICGRIAAATAGAAGLAAFAAVEQGS